MHFDSVESPFECVGRALPIALDNAGNLGDFERAWSRMVLETVGGIRLPLRFDRGGRDRQRAIGLERLMRNPPDVPKL